MLINFRYVGEHDDIHLYMMVDIEDEHYTIFLCYLDENRNPNINNRDHLVGQLTNDLYTFVFCRENLRTFSADFFGLKSKIRRHFYFLDVCRRRVGGGDIFKENDPTNIKSISNK